MSIRDVDVSIGIDVDQNPLRQLNQRIDEFIQSLNNITTNGIDDFINSINNASGDINNLNNNVDDLNNNLNNLGGGGAGNLNNLNNGANQATSGFGKLKGAIVAVGAAITAAIAVDKIVELGGIALSQRPHVQPGIRVGEPHGAGLPVNNQQLRRGVGRRLL